MVENLRHRTFLACSVIVPVYNGATVISRCLDALASQSASQAEYELIIVDDGSTDATANVVMQWQVAHPDLHVTLLRQANAGPAAARNHGARAAVGELLLFTDADCIPAPDWIERLRDAFLAPDAPTGVMGSYRSTQTEPAARFAQYEFEDRYARMLARPSIDLVATYSAAFRRKQFLDIGGFDVSFPEANNEDVELSYRFSQMGETLRFVPEAIVEHEHDRSWASYASTKFRRAYWRSRVYRRYPEKALKDSYTPQLLKLQIPLAALVVLGTVLALVARAPRWLWLGVPFLLSTLPMFRFVARRDVRSAWWTPFGVWVRSVAFGLGILWALLDFAQKDAALWTRGVDASQRPLAKS